MVKFTSVLASVVLLAGRLRFGNACNDGEIGIGYQDSVSGTLGSQEHLCRRKLITTLK